MAMLNTLRSKLAVIGTALALTVGTFWVSGPLNSSETSIEVTGAVKEFLAWLREPNERERRDAIPNVVDDLLAIARVKRALGKSLPGGPDYLVKQQADDLSALVAKLQKDMSLIDSKWRTNNFYTRSILYTELIKRGTTARIVDHFATSNGKLLTNTKPTMDIDELAKRQDKEADELDDLAEKINATLLHKS